MGVHRRASLRAWGIKASSSSEVTSQQTLKGKCCIDTLLCFFSHRYLIPNAGDATRAIKQQIMKVLDALES